MLSKDLDCADHRTEIVEGAYRWCNLFSITRYMRDGSILPRISTSCDDLQRRITKPPKSIVLWSRVPAFTSLFVCISEKSEPRLGSKGAVVKRLSRKNRRERECPDKPWPWVYLLFWLLWFAIDYESLHSSSSRLLISRLYFIKGISPRAINRN